MPTAFDLYAQHARLVDRFFRVSSGSITNAITSRSPPHRSQRVTSAANSQEIERQPCAQQEHAEAVVAVDRQIGAEEAVEDTSTTKPLIVFEVQADENSPLGTTPVDVVFHEYQGGTWTDTMDLMVSP